MNKAFVYSILATVLGIVVILTPAIPSFIVSHSTPAPSRWNNDSYGTTQFSPENLAGAAKNSESSAGIVPNYPADAVTIAIIFLFSLVVAFSAYFYVRHSSILKNGNMPLQL